MGSFVESVMISFMNFSFDFNDGRRIINQRNTLMFIYSRDLDSLLANQWEATQAILNFHSKKNREYKNNWGTERRTSETRNFDRVSSSELGVSHMERTYHTTLGGKIHISQGKRVSRKRTAKFIRKSKDELVTTHSNSNFMPKTVDIKVETNEKDDYTRKTGSDLEALLNTKKLNQKRLLTVHEEKTYGNLVQLLLKIQSMENYVVRTSGRNPTVAEMASLFKMDESAFSQLKSACAEARQQMIDCNLRLVISVAKKIQPKKRGIDLHDLVIVGIDGLTRAVEKFDPTKGYKLSTYAHWWIRQAIDRSILEKRTIKVPIHLWEILSKIRKAQRALRQRLNRDPAYSEIANLLGLDPNRVEHVIQAYQDTESLDMTFKYSDTNAGPIEEVLVVPGSSEVESQLTEQLRTNELSDSRIRMQIDMLLKAVLTERESEILRMRYGFDDGIAKTLDEIGERFQVTRERVRQIEAKVTRKLKSSKQRELLEQEHGTLIDITNSNVSKIRAAGLQRTD